MDEQNCNGNIISLKLISKYKLLMIKFKYIKKSQETFNQLGFFLSASLKLYEVISIFCS